MDSTKEILDKAIELNKKAKTLYEARVYYSIILPDLYNFSLDETANFVCKSRSTVIRYRKIFKNKYKIKKDFKQRKGGRYRYNLTLDQEKKFISSFIKKAMKGDIINIKEIQKEYKEQFGIKVHESSLYRLMKRHGWRKIVPRPYHPKKNKEKTEAFKGDLKKSTD